MSRASANSVPKKCANLYTKETCDWNALILKSIIVESSSFRRACYLLPLSTVPVPMPTESSKLQGEFQIFLGQAQHLFESRIQRRKVTFVSNVTMYLQLRLNFKLKRLKRNAYSHGILDNSYFVCSTTLIPCVSTHCVLFLHVVRVFCVCDILQAK